MALDLDQINRDVNSISEDQFNIDEFKSYSRKMDKLNEIMT